MSCSIPSVPWYGIYRRALPSSLQDADDLKSIFCNPVKNDGINSYVLEAETIGGVDIVDIFGDKYVTSSFITSPDLLPISTQ